jgi:DNA-binding LacI/PurR family transcriptional regulator
MRNVSSKDVARAAGVSQTTVSYVLSGRSDVSIPQSTRQRVIEAAQTIGYRPNRAARALVMGKTHLIALWTARVTSSFCAQMVQRIQRLASSEGFEVIISGTVQGDWTLLAQWSVDGVLAFELPPEMISFKEKVSTSGIPFVSFGAYHTEGSDYVGVDLYSGTVQAVEHLYQVGCRRIVHLTSKPGLVGEARSEAYASKAGSYGIPVKYIATQDDTSVSGYDAVSNYLLSNPCPDGLFCRNDEIAIGACRALKDAGLRIPDDVAVVGCDGIEIARFVEPPLTTIEQPIDELCELTWTYLQNRMRDRSCLPQQTILKPNLIVRASSAR